MDKEGGFQCLGCNREVETNSHVLSCIAYSELMVGKDMDKNRDMVDYFREVIKLRKIKEGGKTE